LGGNIGDRREALEEAASRLRELPARILNKSSIYETEPWGYSSGAVYFNQCLEIAHSLEPGALLSACQKIEKNMGRRKTKEGYEDRIIDIDLLFIEDMIINQADLRIPHPEIQKRRFVLEPLNEISSDLVHPVLKKTIRTLLKECKDPLKVNKC
jgi:2-amino-4-hydroxy-6-hydroxymethyldihydropteridine diphosphokinase